MSDHVAKRELFDAFSEVANALASGRRLEIVDILAQGERSVDELAKEIDQSLPNTSHHLQVLLRAGLVRSRREGTFIYYRLGDISVEVLWSSLRKVAETLKPEVDGLASAYIGDTDAIVKLSRQELLEKMSRGEVLVLDVRPTFEYASGHVPGAWSVPVDELELYLTDIPQDLAIVAYCRGPYCAFAPEAARKLSEAGFQTMMMEEGFPQWRNSGFPVVIGLDKGQI